MNNIQLGAIERPKDKRDFKLGAISAPVDKPSSYLPDLIKYPKFDQQQQPACGAHSGAMLVEVLRSNELNTIIQTSPRFLWTEIKKIDGYPIETGTDMRSILKVIQSIGVCDFSLAGNDTSLSLIDYANLPITQPMLDNASEKVISSYAFSDNPTFDQLTDYIWQHKAVIILIRCDDGFFRTTTPTFTNESYGHFVIAAGYNENGIYIIDSTETDFSLSVKFIDKKYMSFIKEVGTSLELTEEQIKTIKVLNSIGKIYPPILQAIINAVNNLIKLWQK